MRPAKYVFVAGVQELNDWFKTLGQRCCLYCKRIGTLHKHGSVNGNDHSQDQGRVCRGCRALCYKGRKSKGCGRTFSVMLAEFLPRHSLTTGLLQDMLDGIENGRTVKSVWETLKTKLALETFYHALQRLRKGMDRLRTALSSLAPPPATEHRLPLLQTITHLRNAFPKQGCPLSAFQCTLQKPFMG